MPDGQNAHGATAMQIALFLLGESVGGTTVDEVVLSNPQGGIVATGEPENVLASAPKPLECSALEREGRTIVTCRPLPAGVATDAFRPEHQDCGGGLGDFIRERCGAEKSGRILLFGHRDSLLVSTEQFLQFESEFLIITPFFTMEVREPGEWERQRDTVAVVQLNRVSPEELADEHFRVDDAARITAEEDLAESLRLAGYENQQIHGF
jgi:hypothetical protein